MCKKILLDILLGIIVFFSSIILSFCAKDWIKSLTSSFFVVEKKVSIQISEDMPEGKGVWILYDGSSKEYFEELRMASENNNEWTYIQGEEGISWTRLESDNRGAEIKISTKANPECYIAFLQVDWGGLIEIQADGERKMYDLYKMNDAGVLRVYPFENMNYDTAFRVFFHILISAIIILMFTYFCVLLKTKHKIQECFADKGKLS